MLKLSIERGRTKNRYIYTYIAESDKLTLDSELGDSIVRVSVTCSNLIELRHLLPKLLTQISENRHCKWQLLTGWKEVDPYLTPARSRLKEKKLHDFGFRFVSKDGYRIGLTAPLEKLEDFHCDQIISRSSYAISTASNMITEENIATCIGLIRSSARVFPAPDSTALDFLTRTQSMLVFVVSDNTVRPGVIILSGESFELNAIASLEDAVGTICSGSEAESVWAL